jgi:ABC-type bacteriocin/lantibiotic exporter with double-glycine peptidase domain
VNFTPSHGQVQRIILARALYRNPDLLILDEFTSALDSNTEAEIVEEIMELFKNKSIIMISHKEKTLRLCNRIFQLENEGMKTV